MDIRNITLVNSYLQDGNAAVYISASEDSSLSIDGFTLSNVSLSNGISAMVVGNYASVSISNLNAMEVHPQSPQDTTTMVLNLEKVTAKQDTSITIQNAQMTSSSVPFLKVGNSQQSRDIDALLTLRNVVIQD